MRKSTAASSSSLSTGMKVGASNASKWEQRRQVDSFRKNAMGNGTSKTVAIPLASQANQISRLFRMARKSGHLNLTSKELHEVPDQVLHLFHFLEEDEKPWECMPLQRLDLSYNEIHALPDNFDVIDSLITFKIRHNKLVQVPECLFLIESLVSIDLSNNLLTGCLPATLGSLINLKELILAGNQLTSLPTSLCQLTQLENLRIEENQLSVLPSDIGNLTRLHTLIAYSNLLESLPTSFSSLFQLVTLDLKKNKLESTKDALIHLSSLKFLDLRQNQLDVFPQLPRGSPLDQLFLGYNRLKAISPESILLVKDTLSVLEIRDNKLTHVPECLGHLCKIKTLELSNNELHDLPSGLGYLKDLNHVVLDGNPLRSIRRSILIGGCETLKKFLRTRGSPPPPLPSKTGGNNEEKNQKQGEVLDQPMEEEVVVSNSSFEQYAHLFRDGNSSGILDLTGKRLLEIDVIFSQACSFFSSLGTNLLQLNLSKNQIIHLPKEIALLKSLKTLIVEEVGLQSLDCAIALLPNLQYLRLRKNLLNTNAIDTFLGFGERANICLTLKELDLRNNFLMKAPQSLSFFKALDTLLLSYNKIQTFDGFPWSRLVRLSVISLADNQLTSLGNIHQVPLLTSLSVENNNLVQIPFELARCPHLRALYVFGNPQKSIRMSIVNEGCESVLRHMRNRLPIEQAPVLQHKEVKEKGPIAMEMETVDTENTPPNAHAPASTQPFYTFNNSFGPPVKKSPLPSNNSQPSQIDQQVYKKNSIYGSDHRRSIEQRTVSPSVSVSQHPCAQYSRASPAFLESVPFPVISAVAPASIEAIIKEYDLKIASLELQLDDFSVTAAKRFALKKEIAMVRSMRIKEEKKLQQLSFR